MSETAAEKRKRLLNKSTDAIAANDAAESAPVAKAVIAKAPPVTEKKGIGDLDSNKAVNASLDKAMDPIRFNLRDAVLAKNKPEADKLRKRLLALQASKM